MTNSARLRSWGQHRAKASPSQRALRICDFYTKQDGKWIQSGSYTALNQDSLNEQMGRNAGHEVSTTCDSGWVVTIASGLEKLEPARYPRWY